MNDGVTREVVNRLRQDGFAVLRSPFTAFELGQMRQGFATLRSRVEADPWLFRSRYTSDSSEHDVCGVNDIFSPELYDVAFAIPFENGRLLDLARAVLGPELRFASAQALWDPRRTNYNLQWHRDSGIHDGNTTPSFGSSVLFNVTLLPESSFRAVKGSHRRPLTEAELEVVRDGRLLGMPDEFVVATSAGDVVVASPELLHRGYCRPGQQRQTFHIHLQPKHEDSGGHNSWRYMRHPGLLDRLTPVVRELMRNAIEWDDSHPLTMRQALQRARRTRDNGLAVTAQPTAKDAGGTPPAGLS